MTRKDLSLAQQAVQSAHAAIDFIFMHPNKASPWHEQSNYLVLLALKNEEQLKLLITKCEQNFINYTIFREPDIGNVITALAIEPGKTTQKLVQKIPLLNA